MLLDLVLSALNNTQTCQCKLPYSREGYRSRRYARDGGDRVPAEGSGGDGQEGTVRRGRPGTSGFLFFFSPSSMTMNLLYAGSAAAGRTRALSEKPDLRWTWREVEGGGAREEGEVSFCLWGRQVAPIFK